MRRESSLEFLLAVVANGCYPFRALSLSLFLLLCCCLATAAAAVQQIFVIPDKHHLLLLAACGSRPKLRLQLPLKCGKLIKNALRRRRRRRWPQKWTKNRSEKR